MKTLHQYGGIGTLYFTPGALKTLKKRKAPGMAIPQPAYPAGLYTDVRPVIDKDHMVIDTFDKAPLTCAFYAEYAPGCAPNQAEK